MGKDKVTGNIHKRGWEFDPLTRTLQLKRGYLVRILPVKNTTESVYSIYSIRDHNKKEWVTVRNHTLKAMLFDYIKKYLSGNVEIDRIEVSPALATRLFGENLFGLEELEKSIHVNNTLVLTFEYLGKKIPMHIVFDCKDLTGPVAFRIVRAMKSHVEV